MILTDEEIDALRNYGGEILPRAIEAAVLEKLAAGVSVEPGAYLMQPNDTAHRSLEKSLSFHKVHVRPDWTVTPLYTAEAIAAARLQENERCAKLVEFRMDEQEPWLTGDEIRALIGATP